MIIQGNLLEIGVLNGNDWGISEAGAGNIVSSLIGVPLRLCADRNHGCDYEPKTKKGASIGKILSSSRKGNKISIRAEVSDPMTAYSILHGKIKTVWSIFSSYLDKDAQGYLTGAKALGVSLVDHPAYPAAQFSIVPNSAAAAIELTELEKYYLKFQNLQQQRQNPAEGLKAALFKLEHKCQVK